MKYIDTIIKKSGFKGFLIVVYCIVLTAALLFFFFPYKQEVQWVLALAEKQPDIGVTYTSLLKRFPNRVKVMKLAVLQRRSNDFKEILQVPELTFTMNPLEIFFNRVGLKVHGNPYSGDMQINMNRGVMGAGKNVNRITAIFQDIQLSQHPELNKPGVLLAQLKISGAAYMVIRRRFAESTGTVSVVSRNGKVDLSRYVPFFQQPVDYDEISINARLEEGKLNFSDIVVISPDFEGAATGTLVIQQARPRYSVLDIKGTLKPLSEMAKTLSSFVASGETEGTIPFILKGTLARPRFSIDTG